MSIDDLEVRDETILEVLKVAERIYLLSWYDDADTKDAGIFLDALFRHFGYDPAEQLNEDL